MLHAAVASACGGNGAGRRANHKGSALTSCVSGAVDALKSAGTLTALEKKWLASAGSAPELK